MATTTAPDRLYFTGDDEADRLLVSEPLALLIGFALDQQVTVQKAFSGPLELKRRIGTLDAATIAAMDPADARRGLPAAAGAPPLPGLDGRRRSRPCAPRSPADYGDDAARVWTEAQGRQGPRAAAARPARVRAR